MRNIFKFLTGKPEGERPIGRPRGRWKVNIKIEFSEIECGVVD
jgi:hypothetical protein